jgi:lysophospholipase L1-like esterase
MKKLTLITLLIIGFFMTACGEPETSGIWPFPPALEEHYQNRLTGFINAPAFNAIPFLGDSNTELCGELYPEFWTGNRINRGVSGANSLLVIRLIYDLIYAEAPTEVFVMIGTNEILLNNPAQYRTNMNTIAAILSVPVTFVSVLPNGLYDNNVAITMNHILAETAADLPHVTYLDRYAEFSDGPDGFDPDLFQPDKLHLNRSGCMKLFDNLI